MAINDFRSQILAVIAEFSDREGFSECQGAEVMEAIGLTKEECGGYLSALEREGLVDFEDYQSNGRTQRFIHLTELGWEEVSS